MWVGYKLPHVKIHGNKYMERGGGGISTMNVNWLILWETLQESFYVFPVNGHPCVQGVGLLSFNEIAPHLSQ